MEDDCLPVLDLSRVWYRLIQAIKILTMRFGDNPCIGAIQGKHTLNCGKITRIIINGIVRLKKDQNFSDSSITLVKIIFHKTTLLQ